MPEPVRWHRKSNWIYLFGLTKPLKKYCTPAAQAAQGGLFLSGPPVYPLLNCWTGWGLLSQLGGLNELGGSLIPIQRAIQRATGCPCHAMFCSARMPQFCSSFKGGGCWGGSKSCRQGIATVELQAFTPPWSIVLLS